MNNMFKYNIKHENIYTCNFYEKRIEISFTYLEYYEIVQQDTINIIENNNVDETKQEENELPYMKNIKDNLKRKISYSKNILCYQLHSNNFDENNFKLIPKQVKNLIITKIYDNEETNRYTNILYHIPHNIEILTLIDFRKEKINCDYLSPNVRILICKNTEITYTYLSQRIKILEMGSKNINLMFLPSTIIKLENDKKKIQKYDEIHDTGIYTLLSFIYYSINLYNNKIEIDDININIHYLSLRTIFNDKYSDIYKQYCCNCKNIKIIIGTTNACYYSKLIVYILDTNVEYKGHLANEHKFELDSNIVNNQFKFNMILNFINIHLNKTLKFTRNRCYISSKIENNILEFCIAE